MWFYYLIFCIILLFHIYFFGKKASNQIGYFLCLLLIAIAAFRPSNIDRDYANYVALFNNIEQTGGSAVELSLRLISQVIKWFSNNVVFLFLVYAILGVGLKYVAIKKISEYWILSLLIYFGYFYICFDMTQIREGVAMSFFLLSIPDIQERKFKPFLIKFLVAFFFHYSAIVMLPVFFIVRPKHQSFLPYFILLFISIILLPVNINYMAIIQSIIPIGGIQTKLNFYNQLSEQGIFTQKNIFSVARIMRIAVMIFLAVYIRTVERYNRYARTLLQIYIFSLFVFFLLANLPPVFSYRLGEFLGIVEIITFPLVAYAIKPRFIGEIVVIVIALIFLAYNLLVHQYISFYF